MTQKKTFLVSEPYIDERLDKCISLLIPEESRNYLQNLIDQGKVLVNHRVEKKRYRVQEGDLLEIEMLERPPSTVIPQKIPLEILYEDSDLIIINKPAGMIVHPGAGNPCNTFANALAYYIDTSVFEDTTRAGLVHRLDKDTSGVLMAAKNPETHLQLTELFAQRRIEKTYLAICSGIPQSGLIRGYITRDKKFRQKMTLYPYPPGKYSETIISTQISKGHYSIVEAKPITGRTHQIRVHLQSIHAPIVGDLLYGIQHKPPVLTPRQLLHAVSLVFTHPKTGKKLTVTAPTPPDILSWFSYMEFNSF